MHVYWIALRPELFTIEEGLVTPSLKLKRQAAKKIFGDVLDRLYVETKDTVAGKQIKQQ
ncbi:hypothetical protein SPRG_00907 [Saprolegnia parasitica CBS 223.65]|uniref:AMP-dependent synthetase/ligase domain-containing protein n=1 Tax=Saprolegnia parasitica (strain CBS 223.65) TaxID=695850 RepID=A0A067D852_SAPPC|nr:hypothetical protein SPRG_00907 [Saprolegnia parasitica CBS 223.65]KDO34846.1 hypothetical protein SPRG_00907 [Saprolegnia parasitica CBS 223.65]|eukprot:XP_012194509.1 hypothetical protein SPRG_00907 [Saprolegnia parasitica CBS 223.65]